MSSIPQTSAEQAFPAPRRQETVVMGNQGYLAVLLRLIGVEIYKIRRRMMSKVLSTIAIIIIIGLFGIISIGSIFVISSPAAAFLPPPCTVDLPKGSTCLDHSPTQADLNQAERRELERVSLPLRLPSSLNSALQISAIGGMILIAILASTIVGGEYSVGTIRLLLTRGPTRTQFFLSKIGAILVCIVLSVVVLVFLGILTGALLNLFTGIGYDFSFFTGSWLLHSVLKLLITMLDLFMYAVIALCLATLGRATAAGVAGALIWWGLETLLSGVFYLIGSAFVGPLGNFVKAIPDYFITNSIGALSQNQDSYITTTAQASSISDLQASITLAVYLFIFIGIAWLVNQKRDITN